VTALVSRGKHPTLSLMIVIFTIGCYSVGSAKNEDGSYNIAKSVHQVDLEAKVDSRDLLATSTFGSLRRSEVEKYRGTTSVTAGVQRWHQACEWLIFFEVMKATKESCGRRAFTIDLREWGRLDELQVGVRIIVAAGRVASHCTRTVGESNHVATFVLHHVRPLPADQLFPSAWWWQVSP
jgi:hypothetical protein